MKSLLIQLFGQYNPPTYVVETVDTMYNAIPDGAAGVDWTYVLGVALFAIMLYSVMRLIGQVIK